MIAENQEVAVKRVVWFTVLLALLLAACAPAPGRQRPPRQGNAPAPRPTRPTPAVTAPTQPLKPSPTTPLSAPTPRPGVLLFGIGVHIEPFGVTAQGFHGNGKSDYANSRFFARQVDDLRALAEVVEKHGGHLTVQAQSPFTVVAVQRGETVLADLASRGHEIGLHFHEDAHLGDNPEALPPEKWCEVFKEEIGFIKQAGGVDAVHYWSGGNLYPHLYEAAVCAGLEINSDWKNPATQSTDEALIGIHPWRPAGGTDGHDLTAFAAHDPNGPIIFLPEGLYDREDFASMRHSQNSGGDEAYFAYLKKSLLASLDAAVDGQVNVFHFTVHPGEFRGNPDHPFEVIDRFLTEVVDPLVAAGRVRWATYSQMAAAYRQWETAHPGVDPRHAETTPAAASAPAVASPAPSPAVETAAAPRGYIDFIVNTHDWVHSDESAATLLHLIDLFQKYHIRGEFYVTAPVVRAYVEHYPEVIRRLKDSGMTVSYHVRAPHPLVKGFGDWLNDLNDDQLYQTLHDYETYRLDMRTGQLLRDQPGGYTYVAQVFGSLPVAVAASGGSPRVTAAARKVYADLGARVVVVYHEAGADMEQPLVFTDEGLLVRPADFSIARVNGGNFWWNLITRSNGEQYLPVSLLQKGLNAWWQAQPPRPPYINVLIHENNFYRRGSAAWGSFYYTIDAHGNKQNPLAPPFDLTAPDPSTPRPEEEQAAIWQAYEDLVAYAARHLRVVTAEDLLAMAGR